MPDSTALSPGAPALRRMGLIGNPFAPAPGSLDEPTRAVVHAATLKLLAAIDAEARADRPKPVWVVKRPEVPVLYNTMALSATFSLLASSADLDLLGVFVPLDMMAMGRTRSALSAVAENVSNRTFDRTLAAWVVETLADVDPALPESAGLSPESAGRLRERLQEDPVETIARYYGPCEAEREGEAIDEMLLMWSHRAKRLEEEPTEAAADGEDDAAEDALAEAFAHVPGTPEETALPPEEAPPGIDDQLEAEGLPRRAELLDYVLAYTRAHLSPVVARGIEVYRTRGTSAMAQELKITKAPKKTIAALARFATYRYRKVVVVYDRFDNWNDMPNDNKPAILEALTALRWTLSEHGVMVLAVADGQALEVAEQFAGADHITWDFETLSAMEQVPRRLDVEVVRRWLDSASTDGPSHAIDDGRIQRLIDAAEGDVERFLHAASAAIEDAAARGLDSVDEVAMGAASQEE